MRVLTGWMKVGPVFLLMVAGQAFAAINDSSVHLPLGYRTMQPPASGSKRSVISNCVWQRDVVSWGHETTENR